MTPSLRHFLQTIHLWVGLILALPFIVIGVTGSALLAQREILRYSLPAASSGQSRPIMEIAEAAKPAAPEGTSLNWVQLPATPGDPAGVRFVTATRPVRTTEIYVDPVTLEVLGSSAFARRGPIGRVIADIHEFLMLPPQRGLQTTGWMAVGLTFMCLSGIILWWPRKGRWKSAFLVRRGARGLRLHLDLHHAVGIWGLVVLLAVSVSGIYLAFPQTFSSTLKMAVPKDEAVGRDVPAHIPRIYPTSPEAAIAFARSVVPDARETGVQIPSNPAGNMVVQMESTGRGPSFPGIVVVFDPKNADIAYIDDPRTYSMSDRVLNLNYALHLGTGLGFIWGTLVFLSGFLPLFLAVTGTVIWWKKRRAALTLDDIPAYATAPAPQSLSL